MRFPNKTEETEETEEAEEEGEEEEEEEKGACDSVSSVSLGVGDEARDEAEGFIGECVACFFSAAPLSVSPPSSDPRSFPRLFRL